MLPGAMERTKTKEPRYKRKPRAQVGPCFGFRWPPLTNSSLGCQRLAPRAVTNLTNDGTRRCLTRNHHPLPTARLHPPTRSATGATTRGRSAADTGFLTRWMCSTGPRSSLHAKARKPGRQGRGRGRDRNNTLPRFSYGLLVSPPKFHHSSSASAML